MLNKVILIGNLGRDPEVRYTQDGKPIVTLTIATSEAWRDKNTGERRDKTEWHRVVIFNEGLAKVAQNYLRKGSKVYIEGALSTREWQDPATNTKRYTTEVVLQNYGGQLIMLDGRNSGANEGDAYGEPAGMESPSAGNARYSGTSSGSGGGNAQPLPDDDIPF